MLKVQGTVLGIGVPKVQSWTGHSPLKWSRGILSLFLVARTRIKKCSLLFLFSLPSYNLAKCWKFLLNSPPPHLESTKAQELSIRSRLEDLRPGPRLNLLPLGPWRLVKVLGPLRCCCDCGFRLPEFSHSAGCCRYHAPVPALETDRLKLGDALSIWGLFSMSHS